ncbi:MAG TPA: FRG domain-containing protein [Opitutales bacterium]|nr:FRG domain-containing protein [Opitutales bacterium]
MQIPFIQFATWHTLVPFLSQSEGWVFRGQKSYASDALQTSLERAAKHLRQEPLGLERHVLREFKRRATLSGELNLPHNDDIVQWLALLQHHGAPTRLLDFTHSVWVALFFAVERMQENSEIWCVRGSSFSRRLQAPWSGDKNAALKLILEPSDGSSVPANIPSAVFKDEPFYLNRRLALQQGCFLIPFDVRQSFEANFYSPATGLEEGHDPNLSEITDFLSKTNIFKIMISQDQHSTIRSNLRRMNMTREHLFPGLDGLAMSFWQE